MKAFRTLLLLVTFIGTSIMSFAQQTDYYQNKEGVVLNGYDLVSYHTDYKAEMGRKSYAVNYDGATFYFSSEAHKNMFVANPEKYLPAYGGYCAWGVSEKSSKFPVDPQTFKIHNGHLYFFYNSHYDGEPMNTMIPWNNDEKNMISKADKNWKKMN